MGCTKVIAKTIVLTAAFIVLPALVTDGAFAVDGDWVTLTSLRDVRHARVINDTLYMATSGGILAIADTAGPPRVYVNLDGLGTVNITDILRDASGATWVTAFGRLIRFAGPNSPQYLFYDADDNLFGLLTLADDGQSLWIGTDIGLVLFSKDIDGGQIQDSYTLFGDLNPSPAVNDVLITGDSIWLATSAGLAVADRRDPNLLKSPVNWTTFGLADYPELGTDTVRRVASFEGEMYVGTARGFFRLDRSDSDTVFTPMPVGVGRSFTDVHVENDSLFLFYTGGAAVLKGGIITGLPTTGLPSSPKTGAQLNGVRWLAATAGGVFHQQGAAYAAYPFTGAPGNLVSGLAVNRSGVLTAGLTAANPGQYADASWYALPLAVGARSTRVITDSLGNAWIGTFGNGLWLVTDSVAVNYDETNSTLRGNTDDPPNGSRFVVIHGLDTDGRYIYVACYRALNDHPIAIGDLSRLNVPEGWDSLGAPEGITDVFVSSLDYQGGYLAIGTEQNGVYRYKTGPDPFDKRDDSCVHFTESNGFLISDVIRVVRFSPAGEIWAGTNFGLSRYDSGIDRFVDVRLPAGFGPEVTAIDFDSRGNAWIGAANGLLRLDATTGDITFYTDLNSGLVSSSVTSLFYNHFTGETDIGTTSGISIFPSTTGTPTAALGSVVAFPNPLVIRSDEDRLSFNYAGNATVSILTVVGELVREFPVNIPWDGRNSAGKLVASGVYLFVLTDENGNVSRGKFLVVRDR